jgi:hypothetical protein
MHEFTTIVIYYLGHGCSPQLTRALLAKMERSVEDLNEY